MQAMRMRGILVSEYIKAVGDCDVWFGDAGNFTTVSPYTALWSV